MGPKTENRLAGRTFAERACRCGRIRPGYETPRSIGFCQGLTMDSAQHKEQKIRHQQAFEERKARATQEKGLIIVNTGSGKGKTTAALGLAFRALGQGLKVGIVQFIKGAMATGEAALVHKLNGLSATQP